MTEVATPSEAVQSEMTDTEKPATAENPETNWAPAALAEAATTNGNHGDKSGENGTSPKKDGKANNNNNRNRNRNNNTQKKNNPRGNDANQKKAENGTEGKEAEPAKNGNQPNNNNRNRNRRNPPNAKKGKPADGTAATPAAEKPMPDDVDSLKKELAETRKKLQESERLAEINKKRYSQLNDKWRIMKKESKPEDGADDKPAEKEETDPNNKEIAKLKNQLDNMTKQAANMTEKLKAAEKMAEHHKNRYSQLNEKWRLMKEAEKGGVKEGVVDDEDVHKAEKEPVAAEDKPEEKPKEAVEKEPAAADVKPEVVAAEESTKEEAVSEG